LTLSRLYLEVNIRGQNSSGKIFAKVADASCYFKCIVLTVIMVCIVELPIDHAFDVFNHELSTAWGFYPRIPQALRNSNSVPVHVWPAYSS